MKKTYFAPTSTVVLLASQAVMQFASKLDGQEEGNTVNVGFSEDEYDGEGASRRRDVWDGEDDED